MTQPTIHLLLTLGFISTLPAAEPQRLTQDGTLKLGPVFRSRDEIVFATHENPNLVALQRLNLRDGTQARLHPTVTAHQFDATFSTDGRYHAYAMSSGSPQLVLVIQDLQEKKEATYRPREARAVARTPSITPDGKRVIFAVSDVDGHQIASVDINGQDLQLLTRSTGMNVGPALSPDGRRIAFSSSRDGDFDLYVMNADGSDVRRVLESPGLDLRPAWSPDGKRLAFTSNRDGNYELYLLDLERNSVRRLTDHPEQDDFPAWHPDGKRLIFVSAREGKSELYLLEVAD